MWEMLPVFQCNGKFIYIFLLNYYHNNPLYQGLVAQSVTCLTPGVYKTADPGVSSSITAWSHTLVEIDHEIISMVILLSSTDSRRPRVVVSYKRKYVQEYWLTA